ncbi:MAG: prolyl oligopeptidase family serine peptidase [Chthoniobacter sp.]
MNMFRNFLLLSAATVCGFGSALRAPADDENNPATAEGAPDFPQVLRAAFPRWDANHDGLLTRTEINWGLASPDLQGPDAAALAAVSMAAKGKTPLLTLPVALPALEEASPKCEENYRKALERIAHTPRALFTGALPNLETFRQGSTGSCWCLSALATLIHRDPAEAASRFASEKDGYLFRFNDQRTVWVSAPTDGELAVGSTTGTGGVWSTVYEKAVGEMRIEDGKKADAPLAASTAGSGGKMISILTAHAIKSFSCKPWRQPGADDRALAAQLEKLRAMLREGAENRRLMTAARSAAETKVPGLLVNHVYAVLDYDSASDLVTLRDPHDGNFTPKGEAGPQNGYPLALGTFRVPMPEAVQIMTGFAFEQPVSPGGGAAPAAEPPAFTLPQILSAPLTEGLAAGPGSQVAWIFNDRGRRNVWLAKGPDFTPRPLTHNESDDGQELTKLALTADGQYAVYLRGGEFSANRNTTDPVNPASLPLFPTLQLCAVPVAGGEPRVVAEEASAPAVSPHGSRIAFVKAEHLWLASADGSTPAEPAVTAMGKSSSPVWSPDGSRLAFVSERGDHAFIGIYTDAHTPVRWMAPTLARDSSPRWSPDGKRIAFVRRPATSSGSAPSPKVRTPPWRIMVAAVDEPGEAREVWSSPSAKGAVPTTEGGTNLHWVAEDRLVFLSYQDGWPHLYTVPAAGGQARRLTTGNYMVEHITPSPDGTYLLASANTGPAEEDLDRRHVLKIPVAGGPPEVLTPGAGLEWMPAITGDGAQIAFFSATATRPALPALLPAAGGTPKLLAESALPKDFPTSLVTPKEVRFTASDGLEIHAQLFEAAGGAVKKPAVVYVHGGPARQMLLGWHYSTYYAHAYALNQYLAGRGFVVLSVNYRSGIGYGYDFHHAPKTGSRGAAEYQDILAAGQYLSTLPQVDGRRIGIYGGSWGGYLTALALARNSDLFAAGVDWHGVHRFSTGASKDAAAEAAPVEGENSGKGAAETAWHSSVVGQLDTWKSPVLLVHGDDDRNVAFSQTVDLARGLRGRGVPVETLVLPDETHHLLLYGNAVRALSATAGFLERHLAAP